MKTDLLPELSACFRPTGYITAKGRQYSTVDSFVGKGESMLTVVIQMKSKLNADFIQLFCENQRVPAWYRFVISSMTQENRGHIGPHLLIQRKTLPQ